MLATTHAQKVLVIDDVEMNATLIASVISTLCEVQTATSGTEGLQLALQYNPDLILLDVLMPGMDGFELFRRLKSEPRTAHIPVIFLTAISDMSAEEVGLNMGAADFIAKPFRTAVLLARVRNHLELVRQRHLLERLSHSDGLTGIANRRYFNTMLSREFSRMQRQNQPLGLVMIDVDDFKAFNDHYGHLRGDECLQLVAQAIAQCLQRPGDMVARYGGEEFVCLLPNTPVSGALKLAHDIQTAIAGLQMPHVQAQATDFVTVSMGGGRSHAAGSARQPPVAGPGRCPPVPRQARRPQPDHQRGLAGRRAPSSAHARGIRAPRCRGHPATAAAPWWPRARQVPARGRCGRGTRSPGGVQHGGRPHPGAHVRTAADRHRRAHARMPGHLTAGAHTDAHPTGPTPVPTPADTPPEPTPTPPR
ncbi:Bacteriophytochrome cph2 [Comamonas aquatica]|nr:Bacteriophytochrome cph2 [Comamonas aquatica]